MAQDNDIADDVIPRSLKKSKSNHSAYGKKTYKEIKDLAVANPPDLKARHEKAARTNRATPEKRRELARKRKALGFEGPSREEGTSGGAGAVCA